MKVWIDYVSDKFLDGILWLARFVMYNLAIALSFTWRNTKAFYAWAAPKVSEQLAKLWAWVKLHW